MANFCTGDIQNLFVSFGESMMGDGSSSGAVTTEQLVRAAELGRQGSGNWTLFGTGCRPQLYYDDT